MGMSASQARLLTITARLADNELRSQTINNAKMRLSTQSAQASDNYINALNDANMMFSNYDLTGTSQSQLLTYNALTSYSSYNNQYGLVSSAGQLLVSESEAAMFKAADGNVNAYLKAHGLEYTTTYFEKDKEIKNDDYPVPYNLVGADRLKEMYEAYNSDLTSSEYEKYESYFSSFLQTTEALKAGSKEIVKSYLMYNGNSPQLYSPTGSSGDSVSIGIAGISNGQLANAFKNAFTNGNNTYSISNLEKMGLTKAGIAALNEIVNSVGHDGPVGTISEKRDLKPNNDGTYTLTDGSMKITIGKDQNGKITVSGNTDLVVSGSTNTEDDYSYTWDQNATTIEGVINSLTYTDCEGTYNFKANKDTSGNLTGADAVYKYPDQADFKEALDDLADEIVGYVSSNEELFNFGTFGKNMLEMESSGRLPAGIDLNKVLKSGKTYKTVLSEYTDASNNFFTLVAGGNASKLQELLDNNSISVKDLEDMDLLLKAMKKYNVGYSDEFKTVIDKTIIDQMIDKYGEPKYAWVDETDSTNSGNSDAKAQWYTNMFNRMKSGYKTIENGLASSSEWLRFALESGLVTMEQVDKSYSWKSLDYKTCSNITEQTDNSEAVSKAEAEYNRAMKDIDAKDSMYDIQLKNIDTEHTALQTEYDSVKSVISKNIDRTFKFNQNG